MMRLISCTLVFLAVLLASSSGRTADKILMARLGPHKAALYLSTGRRHRRTRAVAIGHD